jgi:hypothetical protein
MKRVIYLLVAALVTTVVIAPSVAAQGENVQQVQERLQAAQDKVLEAQQYMQSPEGQQALEDAWVSLEEARASLEEAGQQLQKAREGAQEKMQDVTSKERTTKEDLPKSGGAGIGSLAAPAAALLVGGALLGYAVLRRR